MTDSETQSAMGGATPGATICSACKGQYPNDAYTDINKSGKRITRCMKCRGTKIIAKDKYYFREKCEHDKMKYTCETCYPLHYKYIFQERMEWQEYMDKPDLMFHYAKPIFILYGLKVSAFKTPEELNHISNLLATQSVVGDATPFVDDPNMRFCIRCSHYKPKETINKFNFCDECAQDDVVLEDSDSDDIPDDFIFCPTCGHHKEPSQFNHKINATKTKTCNDCRTHRESYGQCRHQIKKSKCAICQTVNMNISFATMDSTQN
jgi:hypothetical protein